MRAAEKEQLKRAEPNDAIYRTTEDMLKPFSYLPKEKKRRIHPTRHLPAQHPGGMVVVPSATGRRAAR